MNDTEDNIYIYDLILKLTEKVLKYKIKICSENFKVNATGKFNLSEKQFVVLFLIYYCQYNTTSHLASSLNQTMPSISIIISKLLQSGYLYKELPKTSEDNRKVFLFLTELGEDALNAVISKLRVNMANFLELLTEEQKKELRLACETLMFKGEELDKQAILINAPHFHILVFKKVIEAIAWWEMYMKKEFKFNGRYKFPLSASHVRILRIIKEYPINQINKLSIILHISESALSIAMKNLINLGYIEKKEIASNEKNYFCISSKGQEIINEADKLLKISLQKYYCLLSEEQKKGIITALKRIDKVFNGIDILSLK